MFSSLQDNKIFIQRFLTFFVIFFIFVYSVLHGNIFYFDDIPREITHKIHFIYDGRVLSELLYILLGASQSIYDISPLTQLLSILILSFSLTILSAKWKMNTISAILSLSFIVCSPYFLQNLSYRFDSLTMGSALSCAILSIAVKDENWSAKTTFYKIFWSLCALNFYQSSANLILTLIAFSSLIKLYNSSPRITFSYFKHNIIFIIFSLLLYKIESKMIHLHIYAQEHALTTFKPLYILKNLFHLSENALSEFGIKGGHLEEILGVILTISFIRMLYLFYKNRGRNSMIMAFGFLVFAFFSLTGPLILLRHPVYSMRTLMANGVLLSIAIFFNIGPQPTLYKNKVSIAIATYTLFIPFIFSYLWGNALHDIQEMNMDIASQIVEDVYSISNGRPVIIRNLTHHQPPLGYKTPHDIDYSFNSMIHFQDSTGIIDTPIPPIAKSILHHRRAIAERDFLFREWDFSYFLMKMKGLQDNAAFIPELLENSEFSKQEALNIRASCSYDAIIKRRFYNLYKRDNHIVVDFHRECPHQP